MFYCFNGLSIQDFITVRLILIRYFELRKDINRDFCLNFERIAVRGLHFESWPLISAFAHNLASNDRIPQQPSPVSFISPRSRLQRTRSGRSP